MAGERRREGSKNGEDGRCKEESDTDGEGDREGSPHGLGRVGADYREETGSDRHED